MDGMAETGYPFGLALAPQPFFWLPRCQVEAPVAQWIEYCPPKAGVAGSIPAGRAKHATSHFHSGARLPRSRYPVFNPQTGHSFEFPNVIRYQDHAL